VVGIFAGSSNSSRPEARFSELDCSASGIAQNSLLGSANERGPPDAHGLERWLRHGAGNGRSARHAGYEYIAITDHSKGLKIAGGINEEQLERQAAEITGMNEALDAAGRSVRVLRAIELNLNPTGEGDMDRKSLARLDLVLGCFHSSLREKDDQTELYLAALRNPDIQILGHPRGRICNFRLGLNADWLRVFALAAELDKAVEIDSYPDRQDLSLDLIRMAQKAACRISIGTDLHGPSQLRFIEFGLAAA
jgi:histidinol phosphatase-like PHP family hydrolase